MDRSFKCYIVDDDELDRLRLQSQIRQYPFLSVAGIFDSAESALIATQDGVHPEVLFLDIDMPGLSGLDLRRELNYIPACIFVTAHPEYAIEGFDVSALDFIIKPIRPDRFAQTMERLESFLILHTKASLLDHTLGTDTNAEMRSLLIFYLSCLIFVTQAQVPADGQQQIDSLLRILQEAPDDTNKINNYIPLIGLYLNYNPQGGIAEVEKALSLATKLKWPKGIALLKNALGLLVGDVGDQNLAREYFEESLQINDRIGAKIAMVNNYNNIGRSYRRQSEFTKATEYFYKALTLAEEINSYEKVALVGTNLTALFMNQNNLIKATEYANLTLENARKAKAPLHEATSLQHLGLIALDQDDTTSARIHFNQALEVCDKNNILTEKIRILMNISGMQIHDHPGNIKLRKELQRTIDQVMPQSPTAVTNLTNMGIEFRNFYLEAKPNPKVEYQDSAVLYFMKALALAENTGAQDMQAQILQAISELDAERGDFKSALENYKNGQIIKDSIYSQDIKNKIAAVEGDRQLAIKEEVIKRSQLETSIQRKQKIVSLIGLALIALIGGLLYRQSQTRKRTNTTLLQLNNQLDEANKIKSKFFAILSHDLRAPVASLINFLYLQKDEENLLSAEEHERHQKRITTNAENLLENMESMLLWSKGQMETFKPDIQSVAVQELFSFIADCFSEQESNTI
ncbi:MAG: tetratricopeptide repeat protein [Saprospiraceae bacterium]|nr:tetratricopeptide repeat protein [Saprospiraceae bacterium]